MEHKYCGVILLLFFFLSFNQLYARQKPDTVSSATLDLVRSASAKQGEKTGALILLKDEHVYVSKGGFTKTVIRVVGKIFDDRARSDYSQIVVPFDSYYEKIKLDFARTITESGVVRNTPGDAIQIKTMPDQPGGVMYTDTRYLTFALSGLNVRVAFDYEVTITDIRQPIPGEWTINHLFDDAQVQLTSPAITRMDPVLESDMTLRIPSSGAYFQYHMYSSSVQPVKKHFRDYTEYFWRVTDIPVLHVESAMPSLSKLAPELVLSSLKSWAQYDKWASKTILDKAVVTPEVRKKARTLTLSARSEIEKVKAVFDFVQTQIQYVNADLDRGGYTPHSPDEVLNSGFGDCKDQATLMVSLLKAAGIPAYPALIAQPPYSQFTQIPTTFFDHVITYVPLKGDTLWLDTTPTVVSFPDLYYPDQNRWAFVVNDKRGRFVKTPGSGAAANDLDFVFNDSFRNGNTLVRLKFNGTGAMSDYPKLILRNLSNGQVQQSFRSEFATIYPLAQLDTVILSDLDSPDTNFRAIVRLHVDTVWHAHQASIKFGSDAIVPMSLFGGLNPENMPSTRYNGIVGGYKFMMRGTENYVPPSSDLLTLSLPPADSMDDEFFSFHRNFSQEEDTVTAHWTLVSKWLRVPKQKYSAYVNDLKKIVKLATWNFFFFNPQSFWTRLSKNDAQSILSDCNNYLTKHPSNALVKLMRGNAYDELGDYAKALRDYREVIKITRGNAYAEVSIGSPLCELNKFDEAIKYADDAIRKDSTFYLAYFDRALCYLDKNDYISGIADLNKSYSLDTLKYSILDAKAQAYAQENDYTKALQIYLQVVRRDSTDVYAYDGIAFAYTVLRQYPQSAKYYLKAIALDSNSSDSYGSLGRDYYKMNDYENCLKYSRKAVALDSTAYYARFNIALAQLRWGHFNQARKLYRASHESAEKDSPFADSVAVRDLERLISRGIHVKEGTAILNDIFHKKTMPK